MAVLRPQIYICEPILMVYQCHENYGKVVLIIEVKTACTSWLPHCYMLPIKSPTAIWEVPSVLKSCRNCFPICLLWGWHFLVKKCVPDYLTDLGYYEAHCAWRKSETATNCLVGVTRSKKSEKFEREGKFIDYPAWRVLLCTSYCIDWPYCTTW